MHKERHTGTYLLLDVLYRGPEVSCHCERGDVRVSSLLLRIFFKMSSVLGLLLGGQSLVLLRSGTDVFKHWNGAISGVIDSPAVKVCSPVVRCLVLRLDVGHEDLGERIFARHPVLLREDVDFEHYVIKKLVGLGVECSAPRVFLKWRQRQICMKEGEG